MVEEDIKYSILMPVISTFSYSSDSSRNKMTFFAMKVVADCVTNSAVT